MILGRNEPFGHSISAYLTLTEKFYDVNWNKVSQVGLVEHSPVDWSQFCPYLCFRLLVQLWLSRIRIGYRCWSKYLFPMIFINDCWANWLFNLNFELRPVYYILGSYLRSVSFLFIHARVCTVTVPTLIDDDRWAMFPSTYTSVSTHIRLNVVMIFRWRAVYIPILRAFCIPLTEKGCRVDGERNATFWSCDFMHDIGWFSCLIRVPFNVL